MTNYKKIKNMSVEEMANYIDLLISKICSNCRNCEFCPLNRTKLSKDLTFCSTSIAFKKWLESEVKNDL